MASKKVARIGQRIRIVEGDDLVRGLLAQWLCDAGYVVEVVEPGRAESRLKAALLIISVASPKAAMPRIGALRAAAATPILLVSARFRRRAGQSQELAHELGVRGVLAKPFTRDELLAAVSASLGDGSPHD